MNHLNRSNRTASVFVGVIIFLASGFLQAQIPDKFENLQIFPEEISQGELMANMRSFAIGLGVRCQFCHVGEEGQPLSEFDFASDEKESKRKARVMIRMRDNINTQFLTQLAQVSPTHSLEVNCVTCHHGQALPKTVEQVMNETIEKDGIEAALQKYRDLREEYYGGFTYDFRELPLNFVSQGLARSGKVDEAIAILKLNLEFQPESYMTHYGLGEALAMKGDTEAALKSLEKAYAMRPNPRIKKKIDELTEKQSK